MLTRGQRRPLLVLRKGLLAVKGNDETTPPRSAASRKKDRIETQIHRRRKAKASSPLEPEWDISQPNPPSQLRLSPFPQHSPDLLKHPREALDPSIPDESVAKPKQ
jgi:hypothetical protein